MKTQHFFVDLTQRPPELSRSFGQLRGFGTHARQGPGGPSLGRMANITTIAQPTSACCNFLASIPNDIPSGTKFRGKAIGDSIAALASAFPDVHRELLSIYVAENVVVVELRIRGTHKGELALGSKTIAPTGKASGYDFPPSRLPIPSTRHNQPLFGTENSRFGIACRTP
jgi:hypothetical protein